MPRYRRPSQKINPRSAFTTIELLIVMGIIAILAAILLLGLRAMTGSSKQQATKTTLSALRSMLAEFESATRYSKSPAAWGWYNGGTRVTVMKGAPLYTDASGIEVNADFWRFPFFTSSGPNGEEFLGGGNGPDPLDAPGDFTSTSGSADDKENIVRNGARQLLSTQLAMNVLLSVPANRSAIQGIPADRYFTPQWVMGRMVEPGPDRVLKTSDDLSSGEDVFYYPGNRVIHQGKPWRWNSTTAGISVEPPGGPWVEEGTESAGLKSVATVLLMDAWDNPILFVPASGLRVRFLNGESALDPAKKGQTTVIVSPEGTTKAATISPDAKGRLIRSGKPFFVSAGPDGDFSTHDDNIYSFEE